MFIERFMAGMAFAVVCAALGALGGALYAAHQIKSDCDTLTIIRLENDRYFCAKTDLHKGEEKEGGFKRG